MKTLGLSLLAVAMFASVGRAAPLNTSAVASGAVWVVHVDFDAVRDSYIVKKAFETCEILRDKAPAHFDKLKEKIGMDVRTDLHGVTMYGKDTDKEHAVMIVFAKVNKSLLLEKVEKATDHKVAPTWGGDPTIHSWTMKGHGKTHTAAGAFFKDSAVVFAATPDAVAAALKVLAGKEPGLSGSSPLATDVLSGTTVLARATAIDPKMHDPVLSQATAFRIAMGEHEGKSFYRANVTMKSHAAAEEVSKIAEGFTALVSLRYGSDADVMKLVNGLKTTVDNTTLKVRWEAPVADVWTVIEKESKKIAEHIHKDGEHHYAPGKHGEGKKSSDDNF